MLIHLNKKHIKKTNRQTERKKRESVGPAPDRRTKEEKSDGEILLIFILLLSSPTIVAPGAQPLLGEEVWGMGSRKKKNIMYNICENI